MFFGTKAEVSIKNPDFYGKSEQKESVQLGMDYLLHCLCHAYSLSPNYKHENFVGNLTYYQIKTYYKNSLKEKSEQYKTLANILASCSQFHSEDQLKTFNFLLENL